MTFTVTSVDAAPPELYEQVPFKFSLLREVKGPDRPDYWLAELEAPLRWIQQGRETYVRHVVVASRHGGAHLNARTRSIVLGLAFVTDETALTDQHLDLAKCHYSAIVEAMNDANAV